MNDVQFNVEDKSFNAPTYRDTTKKSKMVQLVMKTGWVKDETQANYVLLGVAIFFFVATAFISVNTMGGATGETAVLPMQKTQIPESIIQQLSPEDMAQIPNSFYREDIPANILNKLPSDITNKIPSRSN